MNAHVPPEHRLMPPIGVYAIPVAPATTDDRALARIYDELAEYLDTVYHLPGRDELRNLAALHGWSPRTPFTATRWQNRHERQVILVVADYTPPGVERCDHGRARIVARRPFQGPLRHPAVPDAHRHYTEIRSARAATASSSSTSAPRPPAGSPHRRGRPSPGPRSTGSPSPPAPAAAAPHTPRCPDTPNTPHNP